MPPTLAQPVNNDFERQYTNDDNSMSQSSIKHSSSADAVDILAAVSSSILSNTSHHDDCSGNFNSDGTYEHEVEINKSVSNGDEFPNGNMTFIV